MSAADASRGRRVAVEICWAEDPGAVVWVGKRTLHHYWPLLSPYFRDVLLPPQRRSDESTVSWNWREPADAAPATPGEFATLRKRLSGDQQSFADNLARGGHGLEEAGGQHTLGGVDQLGVVMATVVESLVAKPDADLAHYVCRTDSGLRLHSWGAPVAGKPFHPDDRRAKTDAAADDRPGSAPAQVPSPRGTDLARGGSRRRWRWVSAIALLALGAGGWMLHRQRMAVPLAPIPQLAAKVAEAPREIAAAPGVARRDPHTRAQETGAGAAPVASADAAQTGRARQASPVASAPASEAPRPAGSEFEREIVTSIADAAPLAPSSAPSTAIGANVAAGAGTGPTSAGESGTPGAETRIVAAAITNADVPIESARAPETGAERGPQVKAPPRGKGAGPLPTEASPPANPPAEVSEDASTAAGSAPPPRPPAAGNAPEATPPAVASLAHETHTPESGAQVAEAEAAEVETRPPTFPNAPARPRIRAAQPRFEGSPDVALARETGPTRELPPPVWQRTLRVRFSDPKVRLLGDAILPTVPVPAGRVDDVTGLRDAGWREKRAQVPESFRRLMVQHGVILSIQASNTPLAIAWHHEAGPAAANARASAREAELAWAVAEPPTGTYMLRSAEGGWLAEVRIGSDRECVVRLGDGIAVGWMMRVAIAETDDADLANAAPRFTWQSASGAPLAAPLAPARSEEHVYALNVPLATSAADSRHTVALRDRVTDWALVLDIRVRGEGEAASP